MILSIDVGYRQVKAIQENSKIVFPSSVAPAKSFAVESIGKIEDYLVKIEREGEGTKKEYFVGNLAEREAMGSLISQNDRVKHLDISHDVLILTAARLLAGGSDINTLVVGLPISYYKAQKNELKQKLKQLSARVSVDKSLETNVKFNEVLVFPQGSGALMTVDTLPENGTVCLIDMGMKTTDCVVSRIHKGQMTPIASLCTSVEMGVKDFYDAVGRHYENRTGSAPNLLRVLELVERKGVATYNREKIDLSEEIDLARLETQSAIIDRVKNSLADIWAELDQVYTAGGGSEIFDTVTQAMGAKKVKDPVWANAKGFLKVGQSKTPTS